MFLIKRIILDQLVLIFSLFIVNHRFSFNIFAQYTDRTQ